MSGDQLTQPGQFQLGSLLFGEGTIYQVQAGSPSGLGAAVKPADEPLGHAPGSYAGPEYDAARVLSWEIQIIAGTGAEAWEAATDLADAFAASTTDQELWGWLPGQGVWWVDGRPRGCVLVPRLLAPDRGHVAARATFVDLVGLTNLDDES